MDPAKKNNGIVSYAQMAYSIVNVKQAVENWIALQWTNKHLWNDPLMVKGQYHSFIK